MRFVLTRDAEDFAARTERLLSASLECNVLATLLMSVREGGHRDPPPIFALGMTERGEVSFAAMRTPPFPLLASPLGGGDAGPLIEGWLELDPDVSAVTGVPETARAITQAWERRTGGTSTLTLSEAMHVLTEVHDPPRPAPGTLRLPRPEERDLLVGWMQDFITEAGLIGAAQSAALIDARMRGQALLVWEHEEPVSMLIVNPVVSGVVRLGHVYTPPEFRRRGYAGSAVAAASRRALAGGATRCMLFTDTANPTSNKIYAEVGYRRCGDWEEIAFQPA
ncbi:MAG: GNAT family N-acetyltransferase [Solirubrobacterales bacterium]|nr:GNAT family N-acetyltransferase [Solirubrobacterales bacterium]